jgi:hypothetical protein
MRKKNTQLTGAPAVVMQRRVRTPARYMHTINGRPGSYDGEQICYATRSSPVKLHETLRQIRRQEVMSKKFRTSKGFDNTAQYGYQRVLVS